MTEVIGRRSLTAEAWVRPQVNPCEIYGGKCGTGTGLSPSILASLCQYHSTNAPSICCSYQKDWRVKTRTFKSNAISDIREDRVTSTWHLRLERRDIHTSTWAPGRHDTLHTGQPFLLPTCYSESSARPARTQGRSLSKVILMSIGRWP
jgi:hypothetical protein